MHPASCCACFTWCWQLLLYEVCGLPERREGYLVSMGRVERVLVDALRAALCLLCRVPAWSVQLLAAV